MKIGSQETLVFSGQAKGIGKIPGLQSDLLVPPSVGHPWTTVASGAPGFRDKTRRDTAADLNIISVHKATPNCKICFFFLSTKSKFWSRNPSASTTGGLWPGIICNSFAKANPGGTPWRTGNRPFERENSNTISSQTSREKTIRRPNGEHSGLPSSGLPYSGLP